ncbi:hypothetical protein AB3S75_013103 [Citrus x aurantiifolia]
MAAAATSALTLFVVTFAVILNTTDADPKILQDVCVADLSSRVQEGSSQVQYYGRTKSLGRSTFQGSSYSLQIPFPSRLIKKTRISYFMSFQLKQHYRETAGVITQMHYLCSKSEKQSSLSI